MPGKGAGRGGAQPSATVPVGEDVKEAVTEAKQKNIRAVKVVIDSKRPRLNVEEIFEAGSISLADDFANINWETVLEDGKACIILIRPKDEKGTVPGAAEGFFVYLGWMPAGVPVRSKMSFSSALASLKTAMEDVIFKELQVAERSEVTLKDIVNVASALTEEERTAMMSRHDQDLINIAKEQVEQVQAFEETHNPKANPQESFKTALAEALADGSDKAVMAKLGGEDGKDLTGEVLSGVAKPSALKGKLPADEACWIVLRRAGDKVLLLLWVPEESDDEATALFKKFLTEHLREQNSKFEVVVEAATEEDELKDELAA